MVLTRGAPLASLAASFLFISLFLFYFYLQPNFQITSLAVDWIELKSEIPNIVHYIWFLKNTDKFSLGFEAFISIYSAQFYFNPDTIYIHTDASAEKIASAKEFGDKWTRIILGLPNLVTKQTVVPLTTNTGKYIEHMEHRSDFARTEILYEMGGVYMDMDVIPIRDIKPFRQSGFANVVGQELGGGINNGMVMHKPGSVLLSIFRQAQHEFYDGGWTTHSTGLLTKVSNRLVPMPYEVMVLQQNTFTPSSWNWDDVRTLMKPHNDTEPLHADDEGALWPVLRTLEDATKWWNARTEDHSWWSTAVKKETWEIDYSSTYTIHAFGSNHVSMIEDWDNEIDIKYLQARQSNYARAIYPAIWHAINAGVIPSQKRL